MLNCVLVGVIIAIFTLVAVIFNFLDELEREMTSSNCHHSSRFDRDEYFERQLEYRIKELEKKCSVTNAESKLIRGILT